MLATFTVRASTYLSFPLCLFSMLERPATSAGVSRPSPPMMPSQRALLALQEQAKAQQHSQKRSRTNKRGKSGAPLAGRPATAPPAVGSPASSPVQREALAFGAGSSLHSRVAAQESKRAAVQAVMSSLSPLQYKSQRPISGAIRRELLPESQSSGLLHSASESDVPVDLNGMPRILGMPPGMQGRPATASRTGSVIYKAEATMLPAGGALIPTATASNGSGIKIVTLFNKSRKMRHQDTSLETVEEAKHTHLWVNHLADLAARDPDTGSRTAAGRALTAAQLAGERHRIGVSAGATPGSAADRTGEVGRLAGRYRRGPDPKVWDLCHTVRGANQVRTCGAGGA